MVSEVRIKIWRDEFEAMADDELRTLAASGRALDRRLDILKLVIQERERAADELDRSEELNIARKANRLAEIANDKASTANTIATMAIIIAMIAAAVSMVTIFVGSGR